MINTMYASAQDWPVCHSWNASLYSLIAISSVVSWLLMMNARSNVLNASMVRKMMAINSSGVTSGSVMRVNVYQPLARSIAAASYRCCGMADNPARHNSITNGDHIQISVIATA